MADPIKRITLADLGPGIDPAGFPYAVDPDDDTRPLCGNRWPLLPDEVQCDRKPGHTGQHRSLERHMLWWGGR